MAINLASKFHPIMLDQFTRDSVTQQASNEKGISFDGVKTVTVVTSVPVATAAYTRSGRNRYGTVTELQDTVQTLAMTQDKGWDFTVDHGNNAEQLDMKKINQRVQQHLKETIIPEVDKYRISSWCSGKGLSSGKSVGTTTGAALTTSNVLETIFTENAKMSDALVPKTDRYLYISELDYVQLQLASQIMLVPNLAGSVIRTGLKGSIDGLNIVTVPSSYMPANVQFFIKWKNASADPWKLKNYKTFQPDDGDCDESVGRYLYDSFVLDTYCNGIRVYKKSST